MTCSSNHIGCAPVARIAECGLVNTEITPDIIEKAIEELFKSTKSQWADVPGGSFRQRWYRSVGGIDKQKTRVVAWKTGAPFHPDYLFFRTVDTNRLLPANLGPFHVQFYATQAFYDENSARVTPNNYRDLMLANLLQDLAFLRARHDMGASDIPILLTNWCNNLTEAAMNYWVELSKGEWTDEQRDVHFCQVAHRFGPGTQPTFYQVDVFVRSMFGDEKVGYVPPFIIFTVPSSKIARALFARPSHMPPQELIDVYPRQCDGRQCEDPNCEFFRLDLSKSLVNRSHLVRPHKFSRPDPRKICNFWGCEEIPDQKCSRCQEVRYCSKEHQLLDWRVHKMVCERRK